MITYFNLKHMKLKSTPFLLFAGMLIALLLSVADALIDDLGLTRYYTIKLTRNA